jgi:predicted phage terminase large subunit-like protein
LEAVERGDIRKLMFFLPPGSAKSTYCQLFSLWYMSKAERSILGASNVTELAERFSRRIRGWAQTFGQTLNVQLDDTTQSAGHWALTNGSTYTAAGVGSAILGVRADLLLTDDPVRSREQSLSDTVRETVWEWYHSSARTRLRPGGAEILVMTRFSEDDLAAQLLERESDWVVVNIPAECEAADDPLGRKVGEMLWPGEYGYAALMHEVKKTTLPAIWSAMYQGRPAPEQGDFFQSSYFRPYTALPREPLSVYGASDYAVSEGRGDFTVHIVVGLDSAGTLYWLDCWRKQAAPDESISAFLDLVKQWRPIGWAVERGQLDNALEPFMREQSRKKKTYVAMEKFGTKGDKAVRASSIRGRLATNAILVPEQASWWPGVRAELLGFPAARRRSRASIAPWFRKTRRAPALESPEQRRATRRYKTGMHANSVLAESARQQRSSARCALTVHRPAAYCPYTRRRSDRRLSIRCEILFFRSATGYLPNRGCAQRQTTSPPDEQIRCEYFLLSPALCARPGCTVP